MNQNGHSLFLQIGMYVVIAALMIFRYSRPQKMSVTRMLMAPIIFLALTCLAIWGEQQTHPSPPMFIALALVVGGIVGIPLGFLRARHTSVRVTDRPGVMYLDSSWVALTVWLGAFIVRAILRAVYHNGTAASVLGDGLLGFAMMTVIASYYFIYEKYRVLERQAGQA